MLRPEIIAHSNIGNFAIKGTLVIRGSITAKEQGGKKVRGPHYYAGKTRLKSSKILIRVNIN